MATALKRIPVTVLTGFLGAGKTTLLQRILSENHGRRIAVIENEFANLDIDSSLVKNKSEETIELKNGCICCSIQDELLSSLVDLASRKEKFDQLVIETTGVANPSSLVQAFLTDPLLQVLFRLNAVVTVVDCHHFSRHVEESQDFRDQIAFADLVVLNKMDLVGRDALEEVAARTREINAAADFLRTSQCHFPLGELFDRFAYDQGRIQLERQPERKESDLPFLVSSLSLEVTGEVDEDKFMAWLKPFVGKHHERMYRTKGIFSFVGHDQHVVVQGVHGIFSAVRAEGNAAEKGKSRMVFIGRDLPKDEIIAGVRSSLAAFQPGSFLFTPLRQPGPLAGASSGDQRIRIV